MTHDKPSKLEEFLDSIEERIALGNPAHLVDTQVLMDVIRKQAAVIEFYSAKRNWAEPKDVDMREWYLIESTDRGTRARQVQAEIEEMLK